MKDEVNIAQPFILFGGMQKAIGRDADIRDELVVLKQAEEWILIGRNLVRQADIVVRQRQRIEQYLDPVVEISTAPDQIAGAVPP